VRPGWGVTTAGCRLCRLSVRAAERVGTVYDLCRVYNPFEWSVPTVWAGYGVVLTTSELHIVGCVGKSCIPLVALLMHGAQCVSCMSFPSRRVRWSLLSTLVLIPVDFPPEDPDFVPEDYE